MKKKENKNYLRGELAKEILFLIATGIIVPASLAAPNLPLILVPLLNSLKKKEIHRNSLIKSINYLKKNKLVSVRESGGYQALTLSEEGKIRILKYRMEDISLKRPKKWDGLWRVLIFDIPERKRKGRDFLRGKLLELGFYQLQKSCFLFPFDCKNEIDFITEFFGIAKYVNYMIVKNIEGEKVLKDFFGV